MIGVLLIRLEGLEGGLISKSSIFFFFPLADVKSKSLIGQYGIFFWYEDLWRVGGKRKKSLVLPTHPANSRLLFSIC